MLMKSEDGKHSADFAGVELPKEHELRIFTIFFDRKTGKYRSVSGDVVFAVDEHHKEFEEVLQRLLEAGRRCDKKIPVSLRLVKD